MIVQDIERTASVRWHGSLKEGNGKASVGSGFIKEVPYTWGSRFAEEIGTNPEEMLGAAHAACFAMQLSALLTEKEYDIHHLDVTAHVFITGTSPRTITHIKLVVHALVDDLEADMFQTQAEEAKRTCPVSRALASVPIELEAVLD
ncbi:MAG: OsmC family peroxiredoxin [Anaerolineaceae bacterium]|jgi:osmotically inducible protein OsmC